MKIGKKVKTVTAPQREVRKVQPKTEPEYYPVKWPVRIDWGADMPKPNIHVTGV